LTDPDFELVGEFIAELDLVVGAMVKAIEPTRWTRSAESRSEGEDKGNKLARLFIYSFYGCGNNADDHE